MLNKNNGNHLPESIVNKHKSVYRLKMKMHLFHMKWTLHLHVCIVYTSNLTNKLAHNVNGNKTNNKKRSKHSTVITLSLYFNNSSFP